jgi:hypothetical protein
MEKEKNKAPVVEEKAPVEEKKEATVTVTKKEFDSLMGKFEEQQRTIDTLMQVADKSRLSHILQQQDKDLIRTAKVAMWPDNGQFILGWKTTKNVCEIVNGKWIEDQRTTLLFEDGESEEIPMIDFYRKISGVAGEIISRTSRVDASGFESEELEIRFKDGKVIKIDKKFINV